MTQTPPGEVETSFISFRSKADPSPANVEAATMFKENIKEYERRVKVGLDDVYTLE